MNQHQTRVSWLSQGYRGECCCGWVGQWHTTATLALVDGHHHSKAEAEAEGPKR